MNPSLRLRLMTAADLPFADGVRELAGWNQTLDDWRRFLAMEPEGCFVAEWNGAPAGTATTTVYGPELAWIGMVLVHPAYRRRGIGNALLENCIASLRNRGVHCIKLDATPLGKTVYDRLGFEDEWTLSRWSCAATLSPSDALDPNIRPWQEADLPVVERLDTAAFGVSRLPLLRRLASQNQGALVLESGLGEMAAFGLLRPGSRALYLGPVVAGSSALAVRLIAALLAPRRGEAIFWDLPDHQTGLVEWAQESGFTRQRSLIRMYLGPNGTPGQPGLQFALAGPEVG